MTPNRLATASTKARLGIYLSILFYSFLICAWGIMDAIFNGNSGVKLIGMGSVVAVFAVLVSALISTLIAFNNTPNSEHKFTRIRTHLGSLAIIACLVIAATIPLFTQIPNQCDASRYSGTESMGRGFYCTWLSVTILYSWVCAIMACLIGFFIRRRAIRSNYDMSTTNIALLSDNVETNREASTKEITSKGDA